MTMRNLDTLGTGCSMHTTAIGVCFAVSTLLSIAGCSSARDPSADLAAAKSAIDRARQAGAAQYAAVPLNEAQQRFGRAEITAADGYAFMASALAEEAQASATLAQFQSEAARARGAGGEGMQPPQSTAQPAPEPPPTVAEAEAAYARAANDPVVVKHAAAELATARKALVLAKAADASDEAAWAITHDAYLAKLDAVIAEEKTRLRITR